MRNPSAAARDDGAVEIAAAHYENTVPGILALSDVNVFLRLALQLTHRAAAQIELHLQLPGQQGVEKQL